jgi:hypothetical protein
LTASATADLDPAQLPRRQILVDDEGDAASAGDVAEPPTATADPPEDLCRWRFVVSDRHVSA